MKKVYEEVTYRVLLISSADVITVSDDTQEDNFDPVASDISW